jgi:AcrR family transcriptional regulator
MPKLSDTTRARRRQHILTSAWRCFSREGFHATSMDDVIAATGMSSSAVYRYFRSKEQIIRASAEIGVANVRQIYVALLDRDPCPDPAETLTFLVEELHRRTDNPDYDMTRLALQTWAEALRDPVLHHRVRQLYVDALEHAAELAQRWCDYGYLPPDADTKAVAATLFSIMEGLVMMHHVVDDVPAHTLRTGVALLGAATRTPPPTSTPGNADHTLTHNDLTDLAAGRND